MIKRPVQEMLDGFAIESYSGKVTGSFDVTNDAGRSLAFGDEVLLVIQASVKPPAYKTDSNGDLQRVEVFAPNEAEIILDGETWGKIEEITGVLGTSGQHRLFNPHVVHVETIEADVDSGLDDESLDLDARIDAHELSVEDVAVRERARAAAADAMEEESYVPNGVGVERIDVPPAGSQDPVLRRFMQEPTGGR